MKTLMQDLAPALRTVVLIMGILLMATGYPGSWQIGEIALPFEELWWVIIAAGIVFLIAIEVGLRNI